MRRFPAEFHDLLTSRGSRILQAKSPAETGLFRDSKNYYASFSNLISRPTARACMKLLDDQLYQFLHVEQRRIPPESITGMREDYSETLNKTMHIKTSFLRRRTSRSYEAADGIGLVEMMRSESFAAFAEALTGLQLDRELSLQVSCYEQGDYAGPHNDHHPEESFMKDGFIDFHVMFSNDAVDHQYLVYAHQGHFSRIVSIKTNGGISVYRLPFWHYTTPLAGKPGREQEARRWLLLGTFAIVG